MSSKKTKLARLQKPAMGTKHLRAASAASAQRRALDTSNLATGSGAPTPGERTLERAIGAQIRELRRQLRERRHLGVVERGLAVRGRVPRGQGCPE